MGHSRLASPFRGALKITGAVDENQSVLLSQESRDKEKSPVPWRYAGPALFPILAKIPGITVSSKTVGGELHYNVEVQGVNNKEFAQTFKMWIEQYQLSLELARRRRSGIISDGFLCGRKYTRLEYRAVVDAIRLFDHILTEFKDKFESDTYPNPIIVYAEAGFDLDHSILKPRRGGRFKHVASGFYGSLTHGESRRHHSAVRVFIGWPRIPLKIIYGALPKPVARLEPLSTFLHELMHHVQNIKGICCNDSDAALLELARKELAASYIPELYAHSLELRELVRKWMKTCFGTSAWCSLAGKVAETQRGIEALLEEPSPRGDSNCPDWGPMKPSTQEPGVM